jgi:hypothetical protein
MYSSAMETAFDYKEAEEVVKVIEVQDNTTAETKMLLKMVYNRGALNVGNGIMFTMEDPFLLVPVEQGKEIIRISGGEVKEATAQEAASFYGMA